MFEVLPFVDEYGQEWGGYNLYHSDHYKDISDYEKEGWYWDCFLASGGPFHTREEAINDANEFTPYVIDYEIEGTREDILETRSRDAYLGY